MGRKKETYPTIHNTLNNKVKFKNIYLEQNKATLGQPSGLTEDKALRLQR